MERGDPERARIQRPDEPVPRGLLRVLGDDRRFSHNPERYWTRLPLRIRPSDDKNQLRAIRQRTKRRFLLVYRFAF